MDNICKFKLKTAGTINIINKNGTERHDIKNAKPKRFMSDIFTLFKIKAPELTEAEIKGESKMFSDSLSVMTEDDIILNEVARNVKKPPLDILRYAILALLLAVMAYAAYQLADRLYMYVSSAREYDALSALFWADDEVLLEAELLRRTRASAPIQDLLSMQRMTAEQRIIQAETSEGVREFSRTRVNMQRLWDINSDFYCWIRVSHTRIDYPVVQGRNNEYYLNHTFDRKFNNSGAIFVDFRNHRDIMRNRHTIIYGHNMLDGSMFQPILDFGRHQDHFMNGIIELITEDAMYYFEVFSAREENPRSGYIEMNFTDEDWVDFLYEQQELSNFNKNLSFGPNDRVVTLSTCINDATRDWRLINGAKNN
jgi:sortase B